MSATEITTFNGLEITNNNRNYIIESLQDNSVNKINFFNKVYSLEEDKFLLDNKQFSNYKYRIESRSFTTIQISQPTTSSLQYLMRARKVSDSSFIYWRSTNVDSTGQNSGFSINELKDICIIAYN